MARPYAKAAFEYAAKHNAIKQWQETLAVAAALSEQKEVRVVFNDPNIAENLLQELFYDLLEIKDEGLKRFFNLIIDYHRLAVLPFILSEFIKLKESHDQAVKAEVISAFELSTEQQEKINRALEKRFDKKILLSHKIDKSILGGAIIKSDDLVIDGSVLGRLSKLHEYLKGDQQS